MAYWSAIGKIGKEKIDSKETQEVINLFEFLVWFILVPKSPDKPFQHLWNLVGLVKKLIPVDIPENHLAYLQDIVGEITDHELKARVADTLWVLKYGNRRKHAEMAIESYLISAKKMNCRFEFLERIERAYRIYLQLGLKNKEVSDKLNVKKTIFDLIENSKNDDSPLLIINLIEILYTTKTADHIPNAQLLERIANELKPEKDPYHIEHDHIERAWKLAAELYRKANNKDKAIECQINMAEVHVNKADIEEKKNQPSYMKISDYLQNAIEAYNRIPKMQDRKEELYDRLTKIQPNIINEMEKFSTRIDVSELCKEVKNAKKAVTGKSPFVALCSFALLLQPPTLNDIKKWIEEYPLLADTLAVRGDSQGKVVAKSSLNDTLEDKMHLYVSHYRYRNLVAGSTLLPALEQIMQEHNIIDLKCCIEKLLKVSPFVPEKRVTAFARGFFHGFHRDFLSASHVLIPQIENSIRHILATCNKQTSRLVEGGIQEEKPLKQTLGCEEIKKILGEDLVFDLKGLLIEKMGDNIRHKVSHGLIDDDFYSSQGSMAYLYCLTLHIIFLTIRNKLEIEKNPK